MEEKQQIPPQPERKRTKSDILAHSTVQEYMASHTKPNGGFKGFLHSNLFAALVIWALSQSVLAGSVIVAFVVRTSNLSSKINQLSEWKGEKEAVFRRLDEWGTTHGHYADERQDGAIIDLQARMKKSEEEGRQWEVIKTEHRRLTEDVEELRHGKK